MGRLIQGVEVRLAIIVIVCLESDDLPFVLRCDP